MTAWPSVKLQEVAQIDRNGVAPSDIEDGTLYVGLEHIESGGRLLEIVPVANGVLASTKFRFTRNHVLYGKLRPYLAKIAMPEFDGICSTDILPVLPKENLDRSYLTHFLRQPSMVRYATSRSTGANLPRLSPKALADFKIPLPPLDEQKRIAAILDQADALRCLRQRALDRLNTLGQSIFYEMFGDPKSNPKGLPKLPLGDLINVSSGEGLTAEKMRPGPYPVYGGNGVNGYHDEFRVGAGTIIIGRVGVYCGAVHITETDAWVTDNALVVFKKQNIGKAYLAAALKYANLNQYAGRSAQPLVSGSRIYPVEILLPSENQQIEFEKKVSAYGNQIETQCNALEKLNSLFSSLQQRAFREEL